MKKKILFCTVLGIFFIAILSFGFLKMYENYYKPTLEDIYNEKKIDDEKYKLFCELKPHKIKIREYEIDRTVPHDLDSIVRYLAKTDEIDPESNFVGIYNKYVLKNSLAWLNPGNVELGRYKAVEFRALDREKNKYQEGLFFIVDDERYYLLMHIQVVLTWEDFKIWYQKLLESNFWDGK